MHNLWIVLLVLLVACGGAKETPFEQLDIQYEGQVATFLKDGKQYTGVAIERYPGLTHYHHIEAGQEVLEEAFYPTGEKERAFQMKAGVRHGSSKMWYKSGQIQLEETYENGELNGTVKRYGPSGELLEEKEFVKGKLSGDE